MGKVETLILMIMYIVKWMEIQRMGKLLKMRLLNSRMKLERKMKFLLKILVPMKVKKRLLMVWIPTLMMLEKVGMMKIMAMAKMVKTREIIMMEEMMVLGMMEEIIIFMMKMKRSLVMVEVGTIILTVKIALILDSSSNLRLEATTLKNMIQQNKRIIIK